MALNTQYVHKFMRFGTEASSPSSVNSLAMIPFSTKVAPKKSTVRKPLYSQRCGRDIVHVKIWKELQDFGIHKSLICNASPFFKKAFNALFEEGKTGIMKMEETEVEVFDLFFTWLYSPKNWCKESQDSDPSQETLFHLYIFADMVQIPSLKNASLRRFYDSVADVDMGELVIAPGLFSYVWDNTMSSSPLRRLIIDLCVWRIDYKIVFADHCASLISSEICLEIMRAMAKKSQGNRPLWRKSGIMMNQRRWSKRDGWDTCPWNVMINVTFETETLRRL